ncbi:MULTISPECIES: halocyanin domain-containing protein [Salinibaculum]|uniref:halocyanin domain-containing protein n=1 Tax=Salinibaculum TaxID=2732368 RepID=UPI0030D5D922
MTESDADLSRRAFMRTAAGTATAAAATGTASAAESNESSGNESSGGGGGGGGPPDLGGYLDGANNYEGSVVDQRGQSEVTVDVGAGSNGLAFGPAAVHVDNGATIVWEWTGEGGNHNVISEDDVFDSGPAKASGTFEHTFNEDGIYPYFCSPHRASGMLGAVVVGTDYPTLDTGGAVGPSDLPGSAKTLGVATMFVTAATLGFAYFFMKYGGDYGDFE